MKNKKPVTIRQASLWLRKAFPIPKGMGKVRRFKFHEKHKDVIGFTSASGKSIELNDKYPYYVLKEALMHEWAHIRVGWKTDYTHTQEFWKELGRIDNAYRQYFQPEEDE